MPEPLHITEDEAREICMEIARRIDELKAGDRHTAVVEATRHGAPAPYIVFAVSHHPAGMEYLKACVVSQQGKKREEPEPSPDAPTPNTET